MHFKNYQEIQESLETRQAVTNLEKTQNRRTLQAAAQKQLIMKKGTRDYDLVMLL